MSHLRHTRIDISEIAEAINQYGGERVFRKYYHYLTTDHEERYYESHLHALVNHYANLRNLKNDKGERKYLPSECELKTVIGGIEYLIDQFNDKSKC